MKWVSVVAVLATGASLCLDDGIPESQRRYIQDAAGNDMAIGLLEGAWQSSALLTSLTRILIQEELGFHAEIDQRIGANGASPIWALAGCADFDQAAMDDKICGNETLIHVSVDSWVGSYASAQNQMQKDFPAIAAVDLGGMGYLGEESIYLRRSVLDAAYSDLGLALDYYKSYNTSHHAPQQYFDLLGSVNSSELKLCSATDMSNAQRMNDYARFSGDYDGVVEQPDGSFVAKCPDGRWWHAPACRVNTSNCIPVFTAGNGWKLQAIMQWTAAYGFPAGVAISDGWSKFVEHVQSFRCLHYWWVPDSTFIDMRPMEVTFPRHSPLEWLKGDKKTGGLGSYVSKMVSSNLASKAGKVSDFVSQINFELPEVQDLLAKVQSDSIYNVSCKWIRENQARWEAWKPLETNCYAGYGLVNEDKVFLASRAGATGCELCPAGAASEEIVDELGKTFQCHPTNCFAGFGLVDAVGTFVSSRANATGCGLCPAGTASEELVDGTGRTFRCNPCPPGYSQGNTFSTTCEPCPKGSATDKFGSTECQVCSVGTYQSSSAQTACIPCNSSRTTELLGASSFTDCVCKEGKIESSLTCVECPEGLHCPRGSTVEKLKDAAGTDLEQPHVKPGFYSNPAVPLETYLCTDHVCPGGPPGTCSGGREGLTCGDCADGYYWAGDTCEQCGFAVPLAWGVCIAMIAVGLVSSYYLLTSSYTAKASVLMCTTASLGMLLALFQNLGVLNTVAVPWPAELAALLNFASIFTLNLDALGFSCAAGGSVVRFASTAAFFWLVVLALPTIAVLTHMIPLLKRRRLAWEKNKTMSTTGQFLQVGFTTMANVGLMPFMCYRHPTNEESVMKYSNVFCGSDDHVVMQIFGCLVLLLAFSFFVIACWAAYMAPTWSGKPRLAAIRFLIFRFRPNVWWFGLVLLARGPLLSLPGVVTTNMPSLRLTLMLCILLGSAGLQLWFLPWKAPILNLVDALSVSLLVVLLAVSLGYVDNSSAEAVQVLQLMGTVISSSMVGILLFMVCLGIVSVVYRSALGSQKELHIFNLGRVPVAANVVSGLRDIATFVCEEGRDERFIKDLEQLSVYDLTSVTRALDILADDLHMSVCQSSMSGGKTARRIAAGTRSMRSRDSSVTSRHSAEIVAKSQMEELTKTAVL